ncbi:hypothetical protein KFL_005930010 [Klebsormidium nitens]|uniref:SET domain-containing protein n=1 Tax=Klebsormidium nitens TaxID=105231 RepID=A0A0U9HKN2_KLENI|nr:hypothetical protein KFL_005930010 [Klebsormidium nitens]|eukprot:GAQ90044.1 hypothetical protein KFL_005930010 [Klebsormidium nitens]
MVNAASVPERDPKYYAMHQHIELRDSGLYGLGLFATAAIKEGEVIWNDDTYNADKYLHTVTEIKSWPLDRQREFMHYCYQVEEVTFSGMTSLEMVQSEVSNYMNHSCDPTYWFLTEDPARMLARRNIKAGEQITYDYATSETTDFRLEFVPLWLRKLPWQAVGQRLSAAGRPETLSGPLHAARPTPYKTRRGRGERRQSLIYTCSAFERRIMEVSDTSGNVNTWRKN